VEELHHFEIYDFPVPLSNYERGPAILIKSPRVKL